MGNLEMHIEAIERAYCDAMKRALDRLEEYEERRLQAFREALRNVNIEEEREKIRKIMSEIHERNGRMRRP